MKSIEVGQRDAVVGHQTKGQLVIVFSLAPLALDVQQGTQVAVHGHVLLTKKNDMLGSSRTFPLRQ